MIYGCSSPSTKVLWDNRIWPILWKALQPAGRIWLIMDVVLGCWLNLHHAAKGMMYVAGAVKSTTAHEITSLATELYAIY